jgi:hypothetical protein
LVRYSTYGRVVSPDDPWGGVGGLLLRDVLADSGGRYEHRIPLPDRTKNRLRKLAQLTSDPTPAKIAGVGMVVVSLEHLRHLDPDTTRVRVGFEIRREPGDGPMPGDDS